jgi:hypothetical protein
MGTVEVIATTHNLENTTTNGNITPHTVEFTNATTSIVASGNVEVGGNATVSSNLTVSGNVEVGTANLFVDTVNSRVGVGTVSPAQSVHVSKVVAGGVNSILVSNPDGNIESSAALKLGVSSEDDTVAKFGIIHERKSPYGGGDTYFCTNYATDTTEVSETDVAITILGANKRVGIGTTSPLETLDTHGTMRSSAPYPRLDFYTTTNRSTNAWGNSTDNAGDYRIYSNGDASDGTKRSLNFDYGQNSTHTTRMAINASGFVGIRTTSPSFPLSVSDASVKTWNAFDNNTSAGDYTFTKSGIYLVGFMYGDGADGNTCEYYTITAATSHGGSCGVTQHKNSGYLNYDVQDHDTVRFWSGSPSNALPPSFNQNNFHLRIYFAGYL